MLLIDNAELLTRHPFFLIDFFFLTSAVYIVISQKSCGLCLHPSQQLFESQLNHFFPPFRLADFALSNDNLKMSTWTAANTTE